MQTLEYIDDYFSGSLPKEEKGSFELRIVSDPAFAEEVAYYCSAMQTVKNQLVEEKKKRFHKIYLQNKITNTGAIRLMNRHWWPYVAAAAVLGGLIVGWFLVSTPTSPHQLADQYIKEHFQQVGVKMSTLEEPMETGKRLYNEGKLPEALSVFESILQKEPESALAKRFAGLSYLQLKKYDQALLYFQQLENTSLNENPGKFLHALTLMERDQPGDKEKAKQLLEWIVKYDLVGKKEAKDWLKKL